MRERQTRESQKRNAHQAVAAPERRGEALQPAVRTPMERTFGHDFSKVRIHADDEAAAHTSSLGADAFTVGYDIAFAPDTFSPETDAGALVLAHELAHVVQQTWGGQQAASIAEAPFLSRTERGGSAERDADVAARAAVSGENASVQVQSAPVVATSFSIDDVVRSVEQYPIPGMGVDYYNDDIAPAPSGGGISGLFANLRNTYAGGGSGAHSGGASNGPKRKFHGGD